MAKQLEAITGLVERVNDKAPVSSSTASGQTRGSTSIRRSRCRNPASVSPSR